MNLTENLVQEVQKVIVGKEDVIKNVLMAILAKGHILLKDIPSALLNARARVVFPTPGMWWVFPSMTRRRTASSTKKEP